MKLAEALIVRADFQTRVEQLRARLVQSAVVQEGDSPPEEPSVLLTDLDNTLGELQTLIAQINATNSTARLPDGRTLTEALAERDVLRLQHSVLESLIQAAAFTRSRYSKSEVRFVPMVDAAELQRQLDSLSQRQRELDIALQAANWSIDLIGS